MTYLLIALILFVAALACLAAELVVPTHGILAIFCVVLALGGVAAAFLASPGLGVLSAVLLVILSPLAFYWVVRIYPQTAVGKRVLLHPQTAPMPTAENESARLAAFVGKRGKAVSILRPAGVCEVDGARLECLAESTMIEAGTEVEVARVLGANVIVRPVDEAPPEA